MADRTIFLVDGFNLYHSVVDIGRDFGRLRVKWLNISSLCASYLHLLGKHATLQDIYYFSALAYHLNDPDVILRHQTYIKCLEKTGIHPVMGRFKPKSIRCPHCKREITRHEEKETDIAIATKMFELLINDDTDIVVLITGDTDLAPAVKAAKQIFPDKRILFAFPYRRKNAELASISPDSFKINKKSYVQHQFPNPVVLCDGTEIFKPINW